MKSKLYKKILVFGILLLFLASTIIPAINAENKPGTTGLSKTSATPPYKLLIIAPSEFSGELQRLVAHKEEKGITTILVTLDEVYAEMDENGRDEAEKIKYYIKMAIEDWETEYVLLVGGKKGQFNRWYMPVRYVDMDNDWEAHFLSDMYFADIYDSEGNFSDWDSDGDGKYSEWYYSGQPEDKFIDLYPDVKLGRLPCRNVIEVKIVVSKIILYENNAYGKSWFNEMVVIAGDTYPEYKNPLWVGYEGEYYGDMAIENMSDFNPTRLYTSLGTLTHWQDILDVLNKGCGIVYFVGHGSPGTWSNHFPNNESRVPGFGVFQMPRLRNIFKLPISI